MAQRSKPTASEIAAAHPFDRTALPIPPYQKAGKLAPTIKDSDPIQWPVEVSAPKGAPNVKVGSGVVTTAQHLGPRRADA